MEHSRTSIVFRHGTADSGSVPLTAYLRRMDPIDPETWKSLTRWERAELGRKLRREGWTYGEIMEVLPVGKGTLAGWCKDIRLSPDQIEEIKARRPAGIRTGIPIDTQRKRRLEIETIRKSAEAEAPFRLTDALWVAGVTLYWGEGSKANNRLELANADPRALRLFMKFARSNHDPEAEFHAALNLHADNDEVRARYWWASALDLPVKNFRKTFIKPDGTGHRKNHLPFGVCRVSLCRSTDALHRTMGWIDGLASYLESGHGYPLVGPLAQLAAQLTLNQKVAGSSPARPTI